MMRGVSAAPDDPPGWADIGTAFRDVYAGAQQAHRVPPPDRRPPAEGAPLHAVHAYRGEGHWHLVTVGLTDPGLRGPNAPVQGVKGGWGYELTLITTAADAPPPWAFELLTGIVRTGVTLGRPFHAGARLAPGAPVDGAASELVAVGIRADPLVRPEGPAKLLQAVGVTAGEYKLMQRVGTALVLDRLAQRDPLLRTDPARA